MRSILVLSLTRLIGNALRAGELVGKSVKVKEDGLLLGRKSGGGLIRDGDALSKTKTYTVKSDDGSFVELVGQTGFLFTQDVEIVAALPKKDDKAKKPDPKDDWTGKKVLPKTAHGGYPIRRLDRREAGVFPSAQLVELRRAPRSRWIPARLRYAS